MRQMLNMQAEVFSQRMTEETLLSPQILKTLNDSVTVVLLLALRRTHPGAPALAMQFGSGRSDSDQVRMAELLMGDATSLDIEASPKHLISDQPTLYRVASHVGQSDHIILKGVPMSRCGMRKFTCVGAKHGAVGSPGHGRA